MDASTESDTTPATHAATMRRPVAVVVRPLAPSDAEAWRALFLAHGRCYGRDLDPRIVKTTWSWLMDPAEPVYGEVAEICGADRPPSVVGIVHYQAMHRTLRGGKVGYLGDLFVHPDHRGQGAGRALIERVLVIARARGWSNVRWLTREDNAPARRLYDSFAPKTDFVLYQIETAE
jgi:ribosomal protein S18 acetylase RimI-like enzyme